MTEEQTAETTATEPTAAVVPEVAQSGDAEPQGLTASEGGAEQEQAEQAKEEVNPWIGSPDGDYSSEGFEKGLNVDEGTISKLAEVCGEMGLSQKSFANIVNKMAPVLEQQQNAAVESFRDSGLRAMYADKQLGGSAYKNTMSVANKAYMKYVPKDIQQLFESSGLNCQPGVIKMFYDFGMALSDDSMPRGSSSPKADGLKAFFNNSRMN